MSDYISRQAAIDAIHERYFLKPLNDSFYRENHEFVTVGYVERILLAVPAAEPQIIRCKDCKYACIDPERESDEIYCSENDFWRDDDFYCSFAKRRTDEQTVS